jgi:hypothetical protein
MANEDGPFLSMAVLCEKVLEEKDTTLSLIRIVDRITAQMPPVAGAPEYMPPVSVSLTAVLSFKSGAARGKHAIRLRSESPSGLRSDGPSFPVLFEGEDRGVNVLAPMAFSATEEGLYWFDVLLDEELVTRMPLRVFYQQLGLGSQSLRQ